MDVSVGGYVSLLSTVLGLLSRESSCSSQSYCLRSQRKLHWIFILGDYLAASPLLDIDDQRGAQVEVKPLS